MWSNKRQEGLLYTVELRVSVEIFEEYRLEIELLLVDYSGVEWTACFPVLYGDSADFSLESATVFLEQLGALPEEPVNVVTQKWSGFDNNNEGRWPTSEGVYNDL